MIIAHRLATVRNADKIYVLEEGMSSSGEAWCSAQQFRRMTSAAWERGAKPVRLLGVGLRLQPLAGDKQDQLSLFV